LVTTLTEIADLLGPAVGGERSLEVENVARTNQLPG
jgi:hypothetical protein